MKILVLNHEFPPVGGGASPVTYELCKQLAGMGHYVDVVTMHFGDLPRFETVDGFNVYRTRAMRKKPDICHTHELATYLPGAFFKTLSLCRKNKYDIIHCHFLVPGAPLAWLVSRLAGIPYIVTCHGSDVPGHNPDRFKLAHKLIKPAWRFLAKRAAMIVSPSQFLKDKILANCDKLNVQTIPNGIYPDRFAPAQKDKSILMCSRILKFKGFQYAIEALQGIADDWRIDVVGQGPYLDQLKALADDLEVKVTFHGWIDKDDQRFCELFAKSSIFVFPSEAENFPTVLLEAMSASMAIITSNAGGCPEVIGDAGLLVEPKNIEQLRSSLQKLMQDDTLRLELSNAALDRVKNFSWENIAARYIQSYRDIIGQRGTGDA